MMLNAGTLDSMKCRRGRVCVLNAGVVHTFHGDKKYDVISSGRINYLLVEGIT